jgi:hypothetical protein
MLAGPEVRNDLGRDFDRDASFWVPACARLAMPNREGTEAAYLDPSAPSKCFANRREDGVDNALNVAALEMWVQLRHPSHQLRLRQSSPRSSGPRIPREPANVRE